MFKDYFLLQFTIANRKLREIGINPYITYILGSVIFVGMFELLFRKTEYSKYVVMLINLSLVSKGNNKSKNEFLLITYGSLKKNLIRILENIIVSIPFVILLCCKFFFEEALLLVVSCISMAFLSFKNNQQFVIPSPFGNHLHEFIVGFRNTFFIYILIYSLTIVSIVVKNYNLGVFSMLIIFLISAGYYTQPDQSYYVWIHAITARQFLVKKIISAAYCVNILSTPVLVSLMLFEPSMVLITFVFYLLGILWVVLFVLAKYAAFPSEINITEGVLMAVSIGFPPLLLFVGPFFYNKSMKNLTLILNDNSKKLA